MTVNAKKFTCAMIYYIIFYEPQASYGIPEKLSENYNIKIDND